MTFLEVSAKFMMDLPLSVRIKTKSMFIWGGVFALAAILIMSFIGYPIGSVVM